MKKSRLRFLFLSLAGLSFIIASFMYGSQPPPLQMTGAPGESNCTSCHGGTANSGIGMDNIEVRDAGNNVVTSYKVGETYTVKATIEEVGVIKYGFEMTVLKTSNDTKAGTFAITDNTRTILRSSGGRDYVSHTANGTAAVGSKGDWTFNWTAPSSNQGNIKFYMATNATNNNNQSTPSGTDHIYTTSLELTPAPVPDLSIAKTVSAGPYHNGEELTFTLSASNTTVNATGVKVSDVLPSALTFMNATPSAGAYNSTTGEWNIGNLNAGANATLTITARANKSGSVTNTATISGNEADGDATNNSSSVMITVDPTSDLSLSKAMSKSPYYNGEEMQFILTATNNGPDAGTGVKVTDLLSGKLTYVSNSTTTGAYNSESGEWNVGNLNIGDSAVLTLTTHPADTGTISNTATIAGSNVDNNTPNNSSSVTFQVELSANLQVNHNASSPPYIKGQPVSFTVTAKNKGPNNASSVSAVYTLSGKLAYKSHTISKGTYNQLTGIWDIGNLEKDSSCMLIIEAELSDTGNARNSLTITATEFDNNSADNQLDFDFLIEEPLYVKDIPFSKLKHYPNPISTVLYVEYQLTKESFVELALVDHQGRLIRVIGSGRQQAGNQSRQYIVSPMPEVGFYLLKITIGETSSYQKVVVAE